MFEVQIGDRAKQEYNDAIAYYETRDINGLIGKFIDEYEEIVAQLEINPYFEKKEKDYRVAPFHKFPYVFFFTISDSEKVVKIVSLFHTAQNPDKYPL